MKRGLRCARRRISFLLVTLSFCLPEIHVFAQVQEITIAGASFPFPRLNSHTDVTGGILSVLMIERTHGRHRGSLSVLMIERTHRRQRGSLFVLMEENTDTGKGSLSVFIISGRHRRQRGHTLRAHHQENAQMLWGAQFPVSWSKGQTNVSEDLLSAVFMRTTHRGQKGHILYCTDHQNTTDVTACILSVLIITRIHRRLFEHPHHTYHTS